MGFIIEADRDRYPGMEHMPDQITIEGGTPKTARLILDALNRQLVAGSGCDDLFILDIDDPESAAFLPQTP